MAAYSKSFTLVDWWNVVWLYYLNGTSLNSVDYHNNLVILLYTGLKFHKYVAEVAMKLDNKISCDLNFTMQVGDRKQGF